MNTLARKLRIAAPAVAALLVPLTATPALACGNDCEPVCFPSFTCNDGYHYVWQDAQCHKYDHSDILGPYCDDGYVCDFGPCGRANERVCNTAATSCSSCADGYHYSAEQATCVFNDVYTPLEPNWMWNLRTHIGDTALNQLLIPGTHDSGTYNMIGLAQTQEDSISRQLEAGIRHLDLRVGRFDDALRIHHSGDFTTGLTLSGVLGDVASFLSSHPNEVVILDCSHFISSEAADNYTFTRQDYQELYNEVYDALSPYLVPNSIKPTSTLNDIWATGDNTHGFAVVNVDSNSDENWAYINKIELLHLWSQQEDGVWADTTDRSTMKSKLQGSINTRDMSKLNLLHTEATPDAGPESALQNSWDPSMLSSAVNPVTERWVAQLWVYTHRLNVVQGDFFNRSALIKIAIWWNMTGGVQPLTNAYPWPPTIPFTYSPVIDLVWGDEWDAKVWSFLY
jgi:hypothetical protein